MYQNIKIKLEYVFICWVKKCQINFDMLKKKNVKWGLVELYRGRNQKIGLGKEIGGRSSIININFFFLEFEIVDVYVKLSENVRNLKIV